MCNVINERTHFDLPGLVIKDSLHGVHDVKGLMQDHKDVDVMAANEAILVVYVLMGSQHNLFL